MEHLSEENLAGETKYKEKSHPIATMFTTNPTRLHLIWNPGRRSGKPAIDRPNYGTALSCWLKFIVIFFNVSTQMVVWQPQIG
jgi:hypothetical protein